ncbi:ATP-binding protein [Paenibacillus hemerocallicola]|uniref:ATP-binding protein n=1 Tax=Paenibacillus hemerocallicola TaxID=1172614 RepID=A0A5C4TA84_9BACL|nr:AAA family ATPase [Paenibacillus hemerocallicola]TNJ65953.1 ATP-binding protein [Paenibacillus hemerocallicola]
MNEKRLIREDFIVITGGPGAGKTTLLNEIQRNGYNYVPEVAREIIQSQVSSDGDALPWKNVLKYRDFMLNESIESYLSALINPPKEKLFFDRGIPDTLAYSYLINVPISEKLESGVQKYRYNKQVFILPPWEEIYKTDNERIQDFEEAVATYEVISRTYKKLDYELIEVPKFDVKQRASFIFNNVGKN